MMNKIKDVSQEQWLKFIAQLPPTALKTLEESIKMAQTGGGATSTVSESGRSSPSHSSITSTTIRRGKTFENGRRNLKNEPVSEEESERRSKRRERNRIAAAKCRYRRQSQIDNLQHQVNKLRKRHAELNAQLTGLNEQRGSLKKTLRYHECRLISGSDNRLDYNGNGDDVESDGLVNMDLENSLMCQTKSEPMLDQEETYEEEPDSINANFPDHLPLLSRPSSLPLPALSMAPTVTSSVGLTRISPLLTPKTINFLNNGESGSNYPANHPFLTHSRHVHDHSDANGNPLNDYTNVSNSIGYLNLLSPSFDTPTTSTGCFQNLDYFSITTAGDSGITYSSAMDTIPLLHTPNGSIF